MPIFVSPVSVYKSHALPLPLHTTPCFSLEPEARSPLQPLTTSTSNPSAPLHLQLRQRTTWLSLPLCCSLLSSPTTFAYCQSNHLDEVCSGETISSRNSVNHRPPTCHLGKVPPQKNRRTRLSLILPKFHVLDSKSPYLHLKEFDEVCGTLHFIIVADDIVRWKLFSFLLKEMAKS